MASHKLLELIDLSKLPKNSWIIEVGSVREPPQDPTQCSSMWLSKKADSNGLNFLTIDFSEETYQVAKSIVGDRAVLGDGGAYLKNFKGDISVLYLDNYDVVHNENHKQTLMDRVGHIYNSKSLALNNEKAAQVHQEQAAAAIDKLTPNAVVIIDDTERRRFGYWGKGALAVPYLLKRGFVILGRTDTGIILKRSHMSDYLKPKNVANILFSQSYFD